MKLSLSWRLSTAHSRFTNYQQYQHDKKTKPVSKIMAAHSSQLQRLILLQQSLSAFTSQEAKLRTLAAIQVNKEQLLTLVKNCLTEYGIYSDQKQQARLQNRAQVVAAIKECRVQGALQWLRANTQRCPQFLQYSLHKIRFNQLLKHSQVEAIKYARKQMSKFARFDQNLKQLISRAVLFNKAENLQKEACRVAQQFWKQVCRAEGRPFEDPLLNLLRCGEKVHSSLLKADLRNAGFLDELQHYFDCFTNQHHSTFVCPVTKQVSSETNFPVLLTCGHVIGNQAMERLEMELDQRSRQGRGESRLMCPICRQRVSEKEKKRIYF